jgi:NAD(P)-dependent dehydrogenase (short-subunit alcohol dehydrogenase family)
MLTVSDRSSKAALHGLVHWLAAAYAKKGITVNGIAPALIEDTTMLPTGNDDLRQRTIGLSALKCETYVDAYLQGYQSDGLASRKRSQSLFF